MSRLGDLENALVGRLSQATVQGGPAFETVRGVSGGHRPVNRDALRRERMPAAYIAFTDEPAAPEVRDRVRGAKFVVLIAARALRVESDPRHGDASSIGVFELMEAGRAQLDAYAPSTGLQLALLHEKFVDADDRSAVYELLYQVRPVVETSADPRFNGSRIAGNDQDLRFQVGPVELQHDVFSFPGLGGVFREVIGVDARIITWRGEVRASTHSGLNVIESDIESRIASQQAGVITDGNGQSFSNCVLDRYERKGDRRQDDGAIVQEAELHFAQLTPLS